MHPCWLMLARKANGRSFEPFAERVWVLRHNVTSHDASYVALAEVLRLPWQLWMSGLQKQRGRLAISWRREAEERIDAEDTDHDY